MSAPSLPKSLHTPEPRLGLLNALRVLAISWRRTATPAVSPALPIGLGVGTLPEGLHQLPLGVPVALVARDAVSARRWFPALLADAVAASGVFLVAPSHEWVDALFEHDTLQRAHAQGQLIIWVRTQELPAHLHHQGLLPFVEELQSAGLRPEQALYLMDAQPLLGNLDVLRLQRLGEQLRVWCSVRQQPVVLGFCPPPEAAAAQRPDVLPMLHGLSNMTVHIATLSAGAEHSTLCLERWNGDHGAVFKIGLGLTLDAHTQRFHHNGSRTEGAGQTLIEAPDEREVIATCAAVAKQAGVPQHWQIVETLDEVAEAAAQSIGATVLLDAGDSDGFEERARLVHHLRQTRPLTLKIVVRETVGKLRSHSEQALLHLGANTIFYRELGFSRLLQLLQDIRTHTYARPVHSDYQQALEAFQPVQARGYQSPSQFSRLVREMLGRTQDCGLAHSMVRLDLAPQIAHITALRAGHISRDGDLITASRSAIYVFLFACRAPDIEAALNRMFDVPVAQLFTAQSTDCSGAGILALLDGLDEVAKQGLPDYSGLLLQTTYTASIQQAGVTAAVTAAAEAAAEATTESHTATGLAALPQSILSTAALSTAAARAECPTLFAKPIGQRLSGRAAPVGSHCTL